MISKSIKIVNKLGLHTRASAKLVSTACKYTSSIKIKSGNKEANGKSIMSIMLLSAIYGSTLEINIDGDDEQAAMDELTTLISNKFGEEK